MFYFVLFIALVLISFSGHILLRVLLWVLGLMVQFATPKPCKIDASRTSHHR